MMPETVSIRQSEARRSFHRKVELLEEWVAAGGPPDGVNWPDGPVALRRWVDDKLGVKAWSSPNIASPAGPYPDLRRRYDVAAAALAKFANLGKEDTLRAVVERLKAENEALILQNLGLRDRCREAETDLAIKSQQLEVARENESMLRKKLSVLRPLQGTRI